MRVAGHPDRNAAVKVIDSPECLRAPWFCGVTDDALAQVSVDLRRSYELEEIELRIAWVPFHAMDLAWRLQLAGHGVATR
jgi:hypothetical protein